MKKITIKEKECILLEEESNHLFIQPVDTHDLEEIENERKEVSYPFSLLLYPINNWNEELSPWKNEPVFGNQGFGEGAKETLDFIQKNILPMFIDKKIYLCGYSLAGLFSLWASYQSDAFVGIVAASPSVWFPGWLEYTRNHSLHTKKVYLSLGDKEENTKNPVMKTVGDCIRTYYKETKEKIPCILEWNQGNHFKDTGKRVGKGIEWMLKEL